MAEANQIGPCAPPRRERALKGEMVEFIDAFEIAEPDAAHDLRVFGRALRRRLSTILSVFLVVLVVGMIATLKQKPVYRAQVTLEIERENPDIPTIQELYQLESVSDDYLKTQYNILASKGLARRVIEQLHLDAISEFNAPRWWSWERHSRSPSPSTFALGSAPAGRNRELEQRVLKRFQSRLTIDPVTRSRLVDVKFESRDPDLAARVVNMLAADFIEQSLDARWVAAQTTAEWLSQQLTGVKSKLEKSEDDLQDYAHKNGLTFLQNDKGVVQNVADDRLRELQQELTRAQAERYSKEAIYRLVQNGDNGALPGVFENRMLQDLTVRLAELKQQRAQLSTTFSPDYPRVKEVQNQIDEIEASLQQERTRAAEQITNEYLAAARREQLVRQALAEQQRQIDVIAERSVQYNILKREVDTNKQLYEGLLQQWKAAGLSASLKAANIRVVDPAEAPVKPVSPILALNLAVTAFLGLALGTCAVFVQERLDDTIKGADDVERLFGFSALGLIPGVSALNGNRRFGSGAGEARTSGNGNGHKSVAPWYRIDRDGAVQPSMTEAFRSLRTAVLLSAADSPPSSMLVTSTQPGEGKTTIATNLALALAQAEQRVLLVDSDLRSPSLHRLFGRWHDPGLVSYLTGRENWHSLVRPSGTNGLDLITCGAVPPNPSELLSSSRMTQLIKSAKEQYDFIILDSAPMLALADSRILAPMVSGVLLVVKSGTVPREQVLHAQKGILSVGGNLLGVVLNRVDLATRGYYDYRSYQSSTEPAWDGEPLEADIRGALNVPQRVR
jgi:succinoglycan biosynthesis transport protein ExoP